MWPLQPFGGMQRRQRDHVLIVAALGQADDHRDRLRDLEHAFLLALHAQPTVVLADGACAVVVILAAAAPCDPVDEIEHVAPARGGELFAVFTVVQVTLVVDVFEPAGEQDFRVSGAGGLPCAVLEVAHVAAELVQRAERAATEHRAEALGEKCFVQARFPPARKLTEARERLVADAALGCRHRTQKRRIVIVVDDQAQPGAQVPDLGAVEEALATRNLVGNVRLAQRLLEHARLVVRAVEHREVAKLDRARTGRRRCRGARRRACLQRLEARDNSLGLVLLVVALDHAHRLAIAERAPQFFLEQLRVVADHHVGCAQDVAGRAVVLLQRDDLERRVLLRQALQVVDGRAAPAVDALVVVADRGEHGTFARQKLQHLVLHGVGVLVLVDQHVAQPVLPLRAHLGVARQQLVRQADQVVEVDGLVGGQALFVALHHALRDLLVGVGGFHHGAVLALAFPGADGPLPAARERVVGGRAGFFQDAEHVVAVEDAELFFEPELFVLGAQYAHAERMESADDKVLGRARADQRFRAFAHLLRGLVGERDRSDLPGRVAGLEQPRDLVRDHAGLA